MKTETLYEKAGSATLGPLWKQASEQIRQTTVAVALYTDFDADNDSRIAVQKLLGSNSGSGFGDAAILKCVREMQRLSHEASTMDSLGACPSNAKSAALGTSGCGSRRSKSQYVATQLITRTGS